MSAKLVGFLNSMEKLNNEELYTVLLKLSTEPGYLRQLLEKSRAGLLDCCRFPDDCIELFDLELTRRLHNLAVIVFYRLGIGLDQKGNFFVAPKSDLLRPDGDYHFTAGVIELGMELVISLMRAKMCILSLSYYNYLRNQVEKCGRKYMSVFSGLSNTYFQHMLGAFLPLNVNLPFVERYRDNDPHQLVPDLTTPLDENFLAQLRETKEGKVKRTLCKHGIQRSIAGQDAKQLCYLSGYADWRHIRCH
jgi:hypothetical protein